MGRGKRKIEEVVLELVRFFDRNAEISEEDFLGVRFVHIRTDVSELLIGKGGKTLLALQFLIQNIWRKMIYDDESLKKEFAFLILDVNGYFSDQLKYQLSILELKVKEILGSEEIKEAILPPMSDYARKVIHNVVKFNWNNLSSESIGEGDGRRIVLRKV